MDEIKHQLILASKCKELIDSTFILIRYQKAKVWPNTIIHFSCFIKTKNANLIYLIDLTSFCYYRLIEKSA